MTEEQSKQLEQLLKIKKAEEKKERDKWLRQFKKDCEKEFGLDYAEIKNLVNLRGTEEPNPMYELAKLYDTSVEELMQHIRSEQQVEYYKRTHNK